MFRTMLSQENSSNISHPNEILIMIKLIGRKASKSSKSNMEMNMWNEIDLLLVYQFSKTSKQTNEAFLTFIPQSMAIKSNAILTILKFHNRKEKTLVKDSRIPKSKDSYLRALKITRTFSNLENQLFRLWMMKMWKLN